MILGCQCALGVAPELWCIAGLCFLLAFFSWGGICITQLGTVAGRASSLALWGFVTALSAVLLVVQVLVTANYLISDSVIERQRGKCSPRAVLSTG